MINLFVFLVAALACLRLTRLVTTDVITEPIRVRIVAKTGIDGWIHTLITCAWCCGWWISAAVGTGVWFYQGPWLMIPLIVFALSEIVGLVSQLDGAR